MTSAQALRFSTDRHCGVDRILDGPPRKDWADEAGRRYLGVPKPPFTPGYELVGIVEELGSACSRLQVGDRVGALTVWGADAERVCVPEANAVEVPEDLDPAEVLSLVFIYMTAYQLLHRTAKVERGETVLVHGAAGRVGTA
ncbi:MAG: hypothetical protein C5B48_06515, partial [Candidatus Rokuibacteriota bacterium]